MALPPVHGNFVLQPLGLVCGRPGLCDFPWSGSYGVLLARCRLWPSIPNSHTLAHSVFEPGWEDPIVCVLPATGRQCGYCVGAGDLSSPGRRSTGDQGLFLNRQKPSHSPIGRWPVSESPLHTLHTPSCMSQAIFSSWSPSADSTPPAL